jgi:hypothetical protein
MVIRGHIENGVIVPHGIISLPNGTEVTITVRSEGSTTGKGPAANQQPVRLPIFDHDGPPDIVLTNERIADEELGSPSVESQGAPTDELSDVEDLLDAEFMESCRRRTTDGPTLEEVNQVLSAFTGSLAECISEERDER